MCKSIRFKEDTHSTHIIVKAWCPFDIQQTNHPLAMKKSKNLPVFD